MLLSEAAPEAVYAHPVAQAQCSLRFLKERRTFFTREFIFAGKNIAHLLAAWQLEWEEGVITPTARGSFDSVRPGAVDRN